MLIHTAAQGLEFCDKKNGFERMISLQKQELTDSGYRARTTKFY